MTFKERYTEAKRAPRVFIKEVQEATKWRFNPNGVSEQTIRQWLSGTAQPNASIRELLEIHFKCPYEELFPNT